MLYVNNFIRRVKYHEISFHLRKQSLDGIVQKFRKTIRLSLLRFPFVNTLKFSRSFSPFFLSFSFWFYFNYLAYSNGLDTAFPTIGAFFNLVLSRGYNTLHYNSWLQLMMTHALSRLLLGPFGPLLFSLAHLRSVNHSINETIVDVDFR